MTAFLGKAILAVGDNHGLLKGLETPIVPPLGREHIRLTCWPQFCGLPHPEPARIFQTLICSLGLSPHGSFQIWAGALKRTFNECKGQTRNFLCTPSLGKAFQAALQVPFHAVGPGPTPTGSRWPGWWREPESGNSR